MEVEEIGHEDVETAMHEMKKARRHGADEVWLRDVGDGWRGGSQVVRKATERVTRM